MEVAERINFRPSHGPYRRRGRYTTSFVTARYVEHLAKGPSYLGSASLIKARCSKQMLARCSAFPSFNTVAFDQNSVVLL